MDEKFKLQKKFKGLSFRLFLSSFLLLSLFLVKQFAVQNQLVREENTSETINTAGHQRMLSQKITKEITFLHYGEQADLKEINENLTLFVKSQEDLIKRGKKDQLVRKEDATILKMAREEMVQYLVKNQVTDLKKGSRQQTLALTNRNFI